MTRPTPSPALDVVLVGSGIVGLATARALRDRLPRARIALLEKEPSLNRHQTGRNSGVLHAGLYYPPGSLKARFAREGNAAVRRYCDAKGIAYEVCGKVLLATSPSEAERLAGIESRAAENGVETVRLSPAALAEREPAARPGPALLVPSTGIVDFSQVAAALAEDLVQAGVELRLGTRLVGLEPEREGLRIDTDRGSLRAGFLVNCAGLFSDRLARLAGVEPPARIVPFRGEYFQLLPEARGLVRHLIYPIPDPALPFLGVHLHRTIAGEVFAGPNAVPAGQREGYRRRDVNARDLAETLTYPGFWRLAVRYGPTGVRELFRSFSRRAFTRSLQRLVPAVRRRDLQPARAGVRAQALYRDGRLVDDFLFGEGERSLHVLNAPSPAATSSLPIGEHVADRVLAALGG